jgi:hypothetical protein
MVPFKWAGLTGFPHKICGRQTISGVEGFWTPGLRTDKRGLL